MKQWLITYDYQHIFLGDNHTGSLAVAAPDMAGAYRVARDKLAGSRRLRIVGCEEVEDGE